MSTGEDNESFTNGRADSPVHLVLEVHIVGIGQALHLYTQDGIISSPGSTCIPRSRHWGGRLVSTHLERSHEGKDLIGILCDHGTVQLVDVVYEPRPDVVQLGLSEVSLFPGQAQPIVLIHLRSVGVLVILVLLGIGRVGQQGVGRVLEVVMPGLVLLLLLVLLSLKILLGLLGDGQDVDDRVGTKRVLLLMVHLSSLEFILVPGRFTGVHVPAAGRVVVDLAYSQLGQGRGQPASRGRAAELDIVPILIDRVQRRRIAKRSLGVDRGLT